MLRNTLIFNLIIVLLIYIHSGTSEPESFTHSVMGEYFIKWKNIGLCEKNRLGTNEIQINLKLTKKNKHTEITGNYTLLIPWDESVVMTINVMILGSNLAWLPNAYKISLTGCSSYIKLLGINNLLLTNINMPTKCPIPKGIYKVKDFDPERLFSHGSGSMIPKQFFYGTYKTVVELNRHGKTIGCSFFMIEMLPLWQKTQKRKGDGRLKE